MDPKVKLERGKELLVYIMRFNLDTMWIRDSSTVFGNRDKVQKMINISTEFGLAEPFIH